MFTSLASALDQIPFAAVAADPRLPAALACAVLAGTIRGFTGFGSALVFIPLMSAIYGPVVAAGTFILIDLAVGAMIVPSVIRKVAWREVLPMAAAAIVAGQFGSLILRYADPTALRWAIAAIVLTIVVVLASGWRYQGRPHLVLGLGVGALSGLLGSSVQIAGPPVIVYWLGGAAADLTVTRANFLGFFTLLSTGLFGTYLWRGIFTAEAVALALFTGPLQVAATWVGAKLFHIASAQVYRRVAYGVVAATALVSLPVFDWLWR
ncbi:MAG TPA: sulfite exporter TauE/SafE family protein [Xanthobacteraceae bacterium]|nr:sulfite exporter TauE/SafE family protein [Xanthobacteraceae bacterium]